MKALVTYSVDKGERLQCHVVPDSAIVRCKDPFFIPDGRDWYGMPLRGVRINRLGKGIDPKYAERYFSECLSAVHIFARNPEESGAQRWARDGALIISPVGAIQEADSEFISKISFLVSEMSRFATLKTGDLILAGHEDDCFEIDRPPANHIIEQKYGTPSFRLKIR